MIETILGLLKGKTVAQMVLDVGFSAISAKLTEYRHTSPEFTQTKQDSLEKYLLENWKEFVKLALYSGINGFFEKLRQEAAKTPSDLDDVQVQAIEFALRALIETVL